MKILVTGHRGLLGSACVRRLVREHQVIVFEGDLADYYQFRNWVGLEKPDAVIHCAAKVGGVKANRDKPVDFLSQNLKIQSTVIESCAFHAIPRLVFIGTSCLYPRDAKTPVAESALLTGPFEPSVEAYAVAKLAGYEMCNAYARQYGFEYMTVAPCNLYGIGDNFGPSAHVIPAIMLRVREAMENDSDVEIWGDGSATREFLYADDAADAILVTMSKRRRDIINIGPGCGTTIKEIADMIIKVSGFKGKVKWDPSKPVGIPHKTFDVSLINSLGWKPTTSIEDGLEKTWKSFMSNSSYRCK